MHAAPTVPHLEGLSWCERSIKPIFNKVVYVSRAKYSPCSSKDNMLGAYAAEALFESILRDKGVKIIHPEMLSLEEQLEIYLGADSLIVAEGSAQHGLELLGVHLRKRIIVICRRKQKNGMEWPLKARFPLVRFLEVLESQWQSIDGVSWDSLALLDWEAVAHTINPLINTPINSFECRALEIESQRQLKNWLLASP